MILLALVNKFSDGFKESWNECQYGGNVEWQEDESVDLPVCEKDTISFEMPAYDDVYAANYQAYCPEHRVSIPLLILVP